MREATLDIPVYARILQNQGIEDIASMLMDVKRILGVPVIAVISDGQRSIAGAVRRVFPRIRHQFCQFHYLRNISMRACGADRNLAKKIRSRIRSLFHYRKSRNPRRKPSERLRRMGEIIYSIISTRARYPRVFAGIEIYEALKRLLENLFHTYDEPRIPGTNNGMEALIRRMKRDIRRMTGWRVSNDYCIRWGRSMFSSWIWMNTG